MSKRGPYGKRGDYDESNGQIAAWRFGHKIYDMCRRPGRYTLYSHRRPIAIVTVEAVTK
jgi:hypothetical protein